MGGLQHACRRAVVSWVVRRGVAAGRLATPMEPGSRPQLTEGQGLQWVRSGPRGEVVSSTGGTGWDAPKSMRRRQLWTWWAPLGQQQAAPRWCPKGRRRWKNWLRCKLIRRGFLTGQPGQEMVVGGPTPRGLARMASPQLGAPGNGSIQHSRQGRRERSPGAGASAGASTGGLAMGSSIINILACGASSPATAESASNP